MCINSIWFYYAYFFFIKYNLLLKFFKYKDKKFNIFLKKTIKWSNNFVSYKFFIVKNYSKFSFQNNVKFAAANNLTRSIIFASKLSNLFDFKIFFSFFFFSFFYNYKIFFVSFKTFYLSFINFMSYLYDPNYFFFFEFFNYYSKEKKHRIQFSKIFKNFWKRYKFNIILLFDYKYSSFFVKICKNTNAFLVGFKYFNSDFINYNYSLFMAHKNVMLKYLIFQQIYDIYTIAVFFKYKLNITFFLKLQNLYFV